MTDNTHCYFQCEDEPTNLILVDAALFGAGNVSGWFSNVFGTDKFRRALPVGEKDKIPIYYLPIPRAVVLELVRAMRFPVLIDDMVLHVPLSIKNHLSLATWRQYLDYYGFMPATASKPKRDGVALREKARAKLAALEASPPFKYARRVAEVLVGQIKLAHPAYTRFMAGQVSEVVCDFLSSFNGARPPTYILQLAGDPVVNPVSVAWYLGHGLKKSEGLWLQSDRAPNDHYFSYCVERAMGERVTVHMNLVVKRQSKAKRPFALYPWPSPSAVLDVSDRNYEVLKMSIVRETGLTRLLTYEEDLLRDAERTLKREETHPEAEPSSDDGSSESRSDSI